MLYETLTGLLSFTAGVHAAGEAKQHPDRLQPQGRHLCCQPNPGAAVAATPECTILPLTNLSHFPLWTYFHAAGKAKAGSNACSVRAGTCIVSQILEQQLQQQVLSEARRAAEAAQQQRAVSHQAASTSQAASEQSKASDGKAGRGFQHSVQCWQRPYWQAFAK